MILKFNNTEILQAYFETKRLDNILFNGQPLLPVDGLFDASGKCLASWYTLTNEYGMDCTKNYTAGGENDYATTSTSPYYVIYENEALSKGVKIIIPNGVTSIGSYAFYNCTSLTSITIPDSVESIGSHAFYNCTSIQSATMPALAISSIPQKSLKTVVITSGTSIGGWAFNDCKALRSITIPDSVTSIGTWAFEGCTRLKTVTFAEGSKLESIDDTAFDSCTSLTSITIPDSVTSIGRSAFEGCFDLVSVTIGSGVTRIGSSAFSACNTLVEVYNRSSLVITVGSSSYGGVGYHAKNVYTPTSGASKLLTQGDYIFYNDGGSYYLMTYCGTDTTDLTLPESVNGNSYSVYPEAFFRCYDLASITCGSGVTSIGYEAFCDCRNLAQVRFGDAVTSIGYSAFDGCSGLTTITIPSSIISIGGGAFAGCYTMVQIIVESGNTVYHSDGNCLIETASKTLIAGCKNSVIPKDGSVTSIGSSAFEDCYSLTNITIPNGVTSIGKDAFYGCSKLESVSIPGGVTSIGWYAFHGCSKLASITIPNSVTSIGISAFGSCTSLTSITVAAGNAKYHSAGNCLIETASKMLVLGCKNSVIPTNGSVTSIGDYAFEDYTSLTSITVPNGVTSIGDAAFRSCTSLKSITLPDSVTSIDLWAFKDCTSLTSIHFNGTKEQWYTIKKSFGWNDNTGAYTIYCTDGNLSKS